MTSPSSPRRVVVWLRPKRGAGAAEALAAAREQARALGGILCAWSGSGAAFDFGGDDAEEALSLARAAAAGPVAVALAEGELTRVDPGGEASAHTALAGGPPIEHAERLSRRTYPGEIVAHESVRGLGAGDLVWLRRVRTRTRPRLTGYALDAPDAPAVTASFARPTQWLGDPKVLEALAVPLGCLGILEAPPATGGTRALEEILARAPGATLLLRPVAHREPLGAVREALAQREGYLEGPLGRGEGVGLWSAAELVAADLSLDAGASATIAIDDAADVDPASLEAIAHLVSLHRALRVVVLLRPDVPLPAALRGIPLAARVALPALGRRDDLALARAFLSSERLEPSFAARLHRTAAGSPLALHEALALVRDRGALARTPAGLGARRKGTRPGSRQSPELLVSARWKSLGPDERAILAALAVLDLPVAADTLAEVTRAVAPDVSGAAVARLMERDWIASEHGRLRIPSRTVSRSIQLELSAAWVAALHRAAAEVARRRGPLAHAAAAIHELAAGSPERARQAALLALRAARKAELHAAAGELLDLARDPDSDEIDTTSAEPELEEPRPPKLDQPESPPVPDSFVPRPLEDTYDDPTTQDDEDDDVLTARAREALLRGDTELLERLLIRLRVRGEHDELVERITSLVQLGRGARSEALHRLREAAYDPTLAPTKKARAILAYAVGLASAGRVENAVLQALVALARARELHDGAGAQACARFLERVTRGAGQDDAASVWAEVASRIGPGSAP